MCGIVGALSFRDTSFRLTESYIVSIRDTMAHRGPDGAGVWLSPSGHIGLGHRRLAVFDLSPTAGQPMGNEDGTLWVVFNGAIYNHLEIRAELEGLGGHRWKTDRCDTEVILHAFEQWGIGCLARLRGMFAIALWDDRRQELWLIRDRLGVKPLYYSIHHRRIVFASEIKALLQDPQQHRGVNEEALFHYLSFLATPAPQTLFDGIHKLPAATWMRISAQGHMVQSRYWDVWDQVQPLVGVSEAEIAERVLGQLRETVELRKAGDVPVGVFLSGGIDSSTNAILFSAAESCPVRTFSIGYAAEFGFPSELPYARQIAERIGAEHHEWELTLNDLITFLPEMIRWQDEPIADPCCVPGYYLARLARQHGAVVCQVGEGADELFYGYRSWKTALRLHRYGALPLAGLVSRGAFQLLRFLGKDHTRTSECLHRISCGLPSFWGGAAAFTEMEKRRILAESLRRQFAKFSSWSAIQPHWQRFREKAWSLSGLNWMTYLDMNLRLPELLLMRVDKMTMAVALEAREPFLDHRLIELVMGIPPSVKLRGGELKFLLKRAMRGRLPEWVVRRPKQAFGLPIHRWFFEHPGMDAPRRLKAFCREAGLLDWSAVSRVLRQGRGLHAWVLLNLALWWEQHIGQVVATLDVLPQDFRKMKVAA